MRELFVTLATIFHTIVTLLRPGGHRALVAEMVALRVQLIAVSRSQKKSPPLSPIQRLLLGLSAGLTSLRRLKRVAIIVKPSTILKFHRFLVKRKYRQLYSNKGKKSGRPPTPKDIVDLVIELKLKNPSFGCPKIAATVFDRTGLEISIETVRRILKTSDLIGPGEGPSWLTFIGQQVDSLWSIDFFKAESILLKTHWIAVVMDQYSRKIIGFAVVQGEALSGADICWMFNTILADKKPPKHLSRDNDPLFKYHQWICNMDILEIDQIRSIPSVPTSHPFIERVIGTTRREFLDHTLFWNASDLQAKLDEFRDYYNNARVHQGISGKRPAVEHQQIERQTTNPENLAWKKFCRGLYTVPMAA